MADPTITSHPTIQMRADASADDLMEEISGILGETDAQLVTLQCALDAEHGPPTGEVAGTSIWAIQRRLELLRSHLSWLLVAK